MHGIKRNLALKSQKVQRDIGILHYLKQIKSQDALFEDPSIGISFEASMLTNWQASYYRTLGGAEIDLILEGDFGLLPIEIKYGSGVKIKQLKALSDFVKEQQSPFGMLINQADKPEWLTPEIVQIPIGWLG
jgi:predicted AAA+ superfamily ATPase